VDFRFGFLEWHPFTFGTLAIGRRMLCRAIRFGRDFADTEGGVSEVVVNPARLELRWLGIFGKVEALPQSSLQKPNRS